MKIIIIGAGPAGSILAEQLVKQNKRLVVIEKEKMPGGMAKSYYKKGFVYEYGPHILAVHNSGEKVASYLKKKVDHIETNLTTASFLRDTLTNYPPSIHSAEKLGLLEIVKNELDGLPKITDTSNFESYLITKVGKTLYSLFFENFTRKFWNVDPSSLSADWAKTRRLGESVNDKKMFFNQKWCAYPKKDWNELFSNLLENVDVLYDTQIKKVDFKNNQVFNDQGDSLEYDLLISTLHIDNLFNQCFGKLDYAGYRIKPQILNRKEYIKLEDQPISMTYYPEEDISYCRVTDYGTFQKKDEYPYENKTIVTYEYPDQKYRLYPFTDSRNLQKFDKYLKEASKINNVITFGRMGLYRYLTTDTTAAMSFRLMEYIDRWREMETDQRYAAYKKIRGEWHN